VNNNYYQNQNQNQNQKEDKKKSSLLEMGIGAMLVTGISSYAFSLFLSKKLDLDRLSKSIQKIDEFVDLNPKLPNDVVVHLRKIVKLSNGLIDLKRRTLTTNTGGAVVFSSGLAASYFTGNYALGISTIISGCYLIGYNIYDSVYVQKLYDEDIIELKETIRKVKDKLNDSDLINL